MSTNTIPSNSGQNDRDVKLKKANLQGGFYNIIDGKRTSSGGKLTVINPANGKELAAVPDIDRDGLERAMAAARAAFPAWHDVLRRAQGEGGRNS
jgi:delta 1-pyrroline-5-carboxylate dehydrogenase